MIARAVASAMVLAWLSGPSAAASDAAASSAPDLGAAENRLAACARQTTDSVLAEALRRFAVSAPEPPPAPDSPLAIRVSKAIEPAYGPDDAAARLKAVARDHDGVGAAAPGYLVARDHAYYWMLNCSVLRDAALGYLSYRDLKQKTAAGDSSQAQLAELEARYGDRVKVLLRAGNRLVEKLDRLMAALGFNAE